MKKIAIALLALSACAVETEVGPTGPQGPEGPAGYSPLKSGSRIKTRVGATADGAKMFLGWFDSERGEACSFRTAADGKVRCLPDAYASLSSAGRKFFFDEACTIPAALVRRCALDGTCELPAIALSAMERLVTGNEDIPLVGVFEVSGPVSAMAFEKTSSECQMIGSPSAKISGEIAPSEFQAMEESLE